MNMNRSVVRWLWLGIILLSVSAASFGQVFISVRIGPPALPVYAQPICPGPGYIWTPGYWAWNDEGGYYWVPGTWVVAPVGLLWTPGYWGWGGGVYMWHPGYWGPHVGFYGGVNYGFGYGGVGFVGGEWRGGAFYYNRSVTNVSVTNVTNVYNKTVVVNNTTVNNVSYNGGTGGLQAQPTAQERAAMNEPHTAPLAAQTQQERVASQNKQNFASENHGRPAIAATSRAGDFSSRSAVPARAAGAAYHAPAMSPQQARVSSTPMNKGNTTAGSSNNGFRPFTPPNSNNRNASTNLNQSRPSNPSQANASRPASQPHYSNPQPQHKSSPQRSNPPREEHGGRER